jgi:hypothetical protein
VGFEPTIPVFERAKIVHVSDRAATVIGTLSLFLTNYALHHEVVWGKGCIDPRFLDFSWRAKFPPGTCVSSADHRSSTGPFLFLFHLNNILKIGSNKKTLYSLPRPLVLLEKSSFLLRA